MAESCTLKTNMDNVLVEKNKIAILVKSLTWVFLIFIPFDNSIYQISSVLIVLLFLYLIFRDNCSLDFFKQNKSLCVIVVLLLMAMSAANTSGDAGVGGWILEGQFIYRFILIVFAVRFFMENNYLPLETLILIVIVAIGIQCINGLSEFIFNVDLLRNREVGIARFDSGTSNPNTFGMILIPLIVILFDLLYNYKKYHIELYQKILILFLFGVSLLCMNLTSSRGAFLGLVSALTIYLGFNIKRFWYLAGIISVIAVLVIFLGWNGNESLYSRFTLAAIEGDIRFQIWKNAIDIFLEYPIFGYGLSDELVYFSDNGAVLIRFPHNSILEVAVHTGVFGVIAFGSLIGLVFFRVMQIVSLTPSPLSIFTGLLVAGLFDHAVFTNSTYLSIWAVFMGYVFWATAPEERVKDRKSG